MRDVEKKSILLVEDEALIALAERRVLESAGYEVTVVSSGEKALELVPDLLTPDLILLALNYGAIDA